MPADLGQQLQATHIAPSSASDGGQRFVVLDELARLVLGTVHAQERLSHARVRDFTAQHSSDVTLKLQELLKNGFADMQTRHCCWLTTVWR
jgi:hypothetical protein